VKVFQEGRVTLVVHRGDDIPHSLDRRERLRAVDVPSDLVEHGEKCVDRYETNAGFDQPTREQAALAESVHAVTLANRLWFLGEIERLPRVRARHQAIGGLEVGVEQFGVVARLEGLERVVDEFAKAFTTLQANF